MPDLPLQIDHMVEGHTAFAQLQALADERFVVCLCFFLLFHHHHPGLLFAPRKWFITKTGILCFPPHTMQFMKHAPMYRIDVKSLFPQSDETNTECAGAKTQHLQTTKSK